MKRGQDNHITPEKDSPKASKPNSRPPHHCQSHWYTQTQLAPVDSGRHQRQSQPRTGNIGTQTSSNIDTTQNAPRII